MIASNRKLTYDPAGTPLVLVAFEVRGNGAGTSLTVQAGSNYATTLSIFEI